MRNRNKNPYKSTLSEEFDMFLEAMEDSNPAVMALQDALEDEEGFELKKGNDGNYHLIYGRSPIIIITDKDFYFPNNKMNKFELDKIMDDPEAVIKNAIAIHYEP
jgi:hypothetical protein